MNNFKHACLAFIAAILLAACSNQDEPPAHTAWQRLPNPPDISAASAGRSVVELIEQQSLLDGLGEAFENLSIRVTDSGNQTVTYRLSLEHLQDDAVASRQIELLLEGGPNGWRITAMHERFACRRGLASASACN